MRRRHRQHLRLYRQRQERGYRPDPAARRGEKGRRTEKDPRDRLPVAAVRKGHSREPAGSGRHARHRQLRPDLCGRRGRDARWKAAVLRRQERPDRGDRPRGHDRAGLGVPAHRRRVRQLVRVLRHPRHPRPLPQPHARRHRAGGAGARRPRRERADRHRAGHHPLGHGPLRKAESRAAAAGTGEDRRHPLDPPALPLPRDHRRRAHRPHCGRGQDRQVSRHSHPAHQQRHSPPHEPPLHRRRDPRAAAKAARAHSGSCAAHEPHHGLARRGRGRV